MLYQINNDADCNQLVSVGNSSEFTFLQLWGIEKSNGALLCLTPSSSTRSTDDDPREAASVGCSSSGSSFQVNAVKAHELLRKCESTALQTYKNM